MKNSNKIKSNKENISKLENEILEKNEENKQIIFANTLLREAIEKANKTIAEYSKKLKDVEEEMKKTTDKFEIFKQKYEIESQCLETDFVKQRNKSLILKNTLDFVLNQL